MVEPDPRAPALTADERAALWRLAERLEGEATTLLDSRRPDRGRAWLAVAARLAAVEASIDHGRWWLVDTYDPAAPRLTAEAARRRPDVVRRSHAAARALWAEARRDFARSGAPDERRLARLERAGNRLAEWRAADQDGRLPRPEDPLATPARAAGWRGAPRPEGAEWARAARDARARVRVLERELDAVHRYDLVRRNCASEIFQVIHDALAELDPEGGVEAESVRRLGGYVPPGRGLAFVPFVSQWEVRRRYRVAETWTIPSWRDRQWRALAEREADWWVALRESTRFGARTYRPNPQDSFFLFFTERAAPVRPVLGAANVVAGLAQATAGLFTWPFDRGRRIVDGLKGVAVSLPELAFVNIRKGTNEWLPPEDVVQQDSARQTPAPVDQGRVRMSLQPPKGLRSAVADSR
jgi:hypothetical protein